jgi:hypothetical protein
MATQSTYTYIEWYREFWTPKGANFNEARQVSRGEEPPPPLLLHVDLHPITERRSSSRPMALNYRPPPPPCCVQTDRHLTWGRRGGEQRGREQCCQYQAVVIRPCLLKILRWRKSALVPLFSWHIYFSTQGVPLSLSTEFVSVRLFGTFFVIFIKLFKLS